MTRNRVTAAPAARVVPGVDYRDITATAFTPRADPDRNFGHRWSSVIAPQRVREAGLDWFLQPRSMIEGLGLAFGDDWRIDVLPSATRGDEFFLLTHLGSGVRLLSRMEPDTDWCAEVFQPSGERVEQGAAGWFEVTEGRWEWLRRTTLSTVDTDDLRSMIAAIGIRPDLPRPAPGEELEQAWLLCAGLIEVWLAEHGYTGDEAAAVRTMIALSGLGALDAYDTTPQRSA